MNYNRPELIEILAAEYALGTLRGRARERMTALLRDSQAMRAAVWRWESRLGSMALSLREATPPASIWSAIEQRIQPNTVVVLMPRARRLWQGFSAVATAAALIMAFLLTTTAPQQPAADHVAVFSNQQAQPQWLVSFDSASGKLTARALNVAATQVNAYELWMLPGGDSAPRSLGLLPTANHAIYSKLSADKAQTLRAAAGLAISLEPAGGSPTGLPTGPVLYQAPLLQL